MNIDLYERAWMSGATVMLAGFVCALVFEAGAHAVHPPSHIETIDPVTVRTESEFANPGISQAAGGRTIVVGVVEMFRFDPSVITVQAGRPVTFRLTSPDVVHGFQIVGTNANVSIVPGYVSELTMTFSRAGEYLIVCNEFCGLSHHLMQGRLIVEGPSR